MEAVPVDAKRIHAFGGVLQQHFEVRNDLDDPLSLIGRGWLAGWLLRA
jgi:hypothetical protein